MVRFQQTLTLAVIAVAVAAQRASELTWPHASHADDIEDILGPGPAHLPPILNDLQPHGGPAGILLPPCKFASFHFVDSRTDVHCSKNILLLWQVVVQS